MLESERASNTSVNAYKDEQFLNRLLNLKTGNRVLKKFEKERIKYLQNKLKNGERQEHIFRHTLVLGNCPHITHAPTHGITHSLPLKQLK